MIFLHELKQALAKKEANYKLTKDDEVMAVLTQKGQNENLTKNIFRARGDGCNERSFTLIKPQGNDRGKYKSHDRVKIFVPSFVNYIPITMKQTNETFFF